MPDHIYIGTAGWSIPGAVAGAFALDGSALQRYASRFCAVEINSTFYRAHRTKTFSRWAAAADESFRFAVKVPRAITHDLRLRDAGELLRTFLDETRHLGEKRGPYLIQLPPSLAYDEAVAAPFFGLARSLTSHAMVCEPRHSSWFGPGADNALSSFQITRAAADPARVSEAGRPGGEPSLAYYRLHGSPRMYYSEYEGAFLTALAETLLRTPARDVWCIFDNTASGAAARNALDLQEQIVRRDAVASLQQAGLREHGAGS
jgi:uncharacterized protein YecE (DUF72 family)